MVKAEKFWDFFSQLDWLEHLLLNEKHLNFSFINNSKIKIY